MVCFNSDDNRKFNRASLPAVDMILQLLGQKWDQLHVRQNATRVNFDFNRLYLVGKNLN